MILDEHRAGAVRTLCELIVPKSGRVHPEVYIGALLARMPAPQRDEMLRAIDAVDPGRLADQAFTPEFMAVRALACEAFYSDFVAPGAPGPGAWEEIDFRPPLAPG